MCWARLCDWWLSLKTFFLHLIWRLDLLSAAKTQLTGKQLCRARNEWNWMSRLSSESIDTGWKYLTSGREQEHLGMTQSLWLLCFVCTHWVTPPPPRGCVPYLLLHPLSCSSLGHDHFWASVEHHTRRVWKKKEMPNSIVCSDLESHLQMAEEHHLQSKTACRYFHWDFLERLVVSVYESQSCHRGRLMLVEWFVLNSSRKLKPPNVLAGLTDQIHWRSMFCFSLQTSFVLKTPRRQKTFKPASVLILLWWWWKDVSFRH